MNKIAISIGALGLAASAFAHAEVPAQLLGDVVPAADGQRTVVISASTRWVNVHEGEIVKFVADNGQSFAFNFDSPSVSSFDLQRVAPNGALDHHLAVYVTPLADGE